LPADTALMVSYQGSREEGFDLHGGGADNVDVCCRAGAAWPVGSALPSVACGSSVLLSPPVSDAGRHDAGASPRTAPLDAAVVDASADASSRDASDAGEVPALPEAILCQLWTNGPADVSVIASGYAPLDDPLDDQLLPDGCGVETQDERLVLRPPDAQ